MRNPFARGATDEPPPPRRCERIEAPREDQGVVDSLSGVFRVETLPEDMRRMLNRIR